MKNKTSLLLMEQLVMVLVFVLAAALCLQAFSKADQVSQETARREEAAVIAQNAAEALKAGREPEPPPEGYTLEITRLPSETSGLALASITVCYEEKILFTLAAGWQEVEP